MSNPIGAPTVPTDDASLALLLESLNARDFTIDRLLEFWSGYDESLEVSDGLHADPITGTELVEYVNYPNPVLHPNDVIRALAVEIQRLRRLA